MVPSPPLCLTTRQTSLWIPTEYSSPYTTSAARVQASSFCTAWGARSWIGSSSLPFSPGDHHVVAFDLRCHGRSGDGPWSWADALGDVGVVAEHLQLVNPAIAGHSLGGMLAVMWGGDHPDSRGVVNLDGHGRKRPDQYVGLDPMDARQRQEQIDAVVQQSLNSLVGPLKAAQVDALLAQQRALAARIGVADAVLVEAAQRSFLTQAGDTRIRPEVRGLGK
ncbi:MAG: alpha/beta hydrolase [Chloroflexi bacterium]|nr:MAG: alpha/beta hydrolase [Chloroflexota bacterium]